jgi:hypothetical protein
MTGKTDDIRSLRSFALGAWRGLAMMFGRPDAIIRKGFISLAEHREISGWLRHLEHFVRRILLVLALDILLPPAKPAAPGPRPGPRRPCFFRRTPALMVLRGRYRLRGQAARPARKPKPRCAADTPVRSAALGRRLEALRHALVHIDASAMRLARTIHRRIHAPVRRGFVRLTPWRVPRWRASLASLAFTPEILKLEQYLPDVFTDDSS